MRTNGVKREEQLPCGQSPSKKLNDSVLAAATTRSLQITTALATGFVWKALATNAVLLPAGPLSLGRQVCLEGRFSSLLILTLTLHDHLCSV